LVSKVLVAVDGSENSDRALDFALGFSEKYDAALTIINVTESSAVAVVPTDIGAYPGNSMMVVARDLRKFHEDILEKALARAKAAKPNLAVTSLLKEGNAASEIATVSKEGNFDFVVVGHRGVGKVRELLIGSISEKVVHTVSCTVIIVK
jgi:nucleotide-binding universal stress UspA family protein